MIANVIVGVPLDPKTMKNEGFTPPIYGQPLKMKVVCSHGLYMFALIKQVCRFELRTRICLFLSLKSSAKNTRWLTPSGTLEAPEN